MNLLVLGKQQERCESSTVPEPSEPHLEQAETFQIPSGPLSGVPWARKRDTQLIFNSDETGILQNSS